MIYSRDKIVKQAASWIGCNESNGSHKEIIDIYNNHTPLARGYKVKYTDAWCATFVSACAIVCKYTNIIPTECSCTQMIELFKKKGVWRENENYTPSPGDIIFYDWDDNGVGDNKGNSDHVGIVEKVKDGSITVIEGNYSNSVKRRTMNVNGKYIRGYGLPKYTKTATKKPEPTTGTKTTEYAKGKSNDLAGIYVTTANLRLRDGAGTKKSILTVMPAGTKVTNYGYYTEVKGVKWLYVKTVVGGVSYTGFCSISYLKKK